MRPRYADWRVHAAVNCASIGCPALRPEAFTATRLDTQLEDGMQRFMADRSRNRYADGKAEISSIFKWFRKDVEKGHQGVRRVEELLARYAAQLSNVAPARGRLRAGMVSITHRDYDWSLTAAARCPRARCTSTVSVRLRLR